MRNKESLIKQKAQVRYLKEGDSSSTFCHVSLTARRMWNTICALWDGSDWDLEEEDIKRKCKKQLLTAQEVVVDND
ncbi:hypothetical protein RIF29_19142 [Crotalaria pallida]|uniref:Uncharacterized protein n=1 Tax=Crotalaria pallida TaxID=3830 RepID=A0AAN9I3W4_CROPI